MSIKGQVYTRGLNFMTAKWLEPKNVLVIAWLDNPFTFAKADE
jgi:hypothetical protein